MRRPAAARILRAGLTRDGSGTTADVAAAALGLRRAEEASARDHAAQQQRWHYRLERGRVWFDNEMRRAHRRFKQSIPAFIAAGSVLNLLTVPVIYSLIVPLLLLDLFVQAVPTPHGRYQAFVDFGDAAGYRQDLSELRRSLRTEHCRPPVSVTPARGDRTGEGARHRPRRSRRQR